MSAKATKPAAARHARAQAPATVATSPPLWALSLVVVALAAATYAPTLWYGFVWDDPISVQRWLPALPTWWSTFVPPANIPQFPNDYYRPLQLMSYQLDRAIGGGDPWAFHLDVVVLHVLATLLMLRAGLRFLPSPAAALWGAALFAVHPIHSESVAWMAARPDVMVACAGLASMLAYWHPTRGAWWRSSVAAVFVLIGLLCKETAAALLLVIPLSEVVLRLPRQGAASSQPRWNVTTLLPFIAAVVVYLVLRSAGLERGMNPVVIIPSNPIAAAVGTIGTYLRLLVLPYPQSAYISELPASGASLAAGALFLAGFAALAWWSWRRKDWPLIFSLLWIAITLAPSLAVVARPPTAPLAERYLYLPSVGFCWAAGLLVARASGGRRAFLAQAAAGAVVAMACFGTLQRNQIWRDNHTLWSDTVTRNTTSGLPVRSLAAVTLERGDVETAQRLFREALEKTNDARGQYLINNNLGTLALKRGNDDEAETFYRKALAIDRTPDCLYNLGWIELKRSMNTELSADGRAAKQRQARSLLMEALASSPYDTDIHIALAQTAEAMSDTPTARKHFEEALRLGVPPTTAASVRRRLKELPAR